MRFELTQLTDAERALQAEVREFLADALPRGSYTPGLGMNAPRDPAFSRSLGARGWLGMALPEAYGGHDRSAVDRLVVTEELLRWGAPVGHHWVADRQSGAVIARFGTEEQKRRFLPKIAAGELSFSIGMSEPDAGSDLASLTTRAVRVGDGWVVTGRKVWTSWADGNDWFIVLCRTTPVEETGDKRLGLSQLLVDLRDPKVHVTTIPFIDGTADFCEVVLDEVFVPDELVLGDVGAGWSQNTAELAFERGGPDRWLSTYPVVEEYLREHEGGVTPEVADVLGGAAAMYWVFHNLTLSVNRAIDAGRAPIDEAALVKEMATRFEQDVVNAVLATLDAAPGLPGRTRFERLLGTATLTAPSFTLRGGTNEILRSVAAKGLQSKEPMVSTAGDDLLVQSAARLLGDAATFEAVEQAERDRWCAPVWDALAEAGFPWISVPEAAGGSGGSLADATAVLRLAGRHAAPVPLAETGILGGWLAAAAGFELPDGPCSVVPDGAALRIEADRLVGEAVVAWGERARRIFAVVRRGDGWVIVGARPDQLAITPGASLAGEPRDTVRFDVALDELDVAPAPAGVDGDALRRRGALTRVVLAAGALDELSRLTVEYTNDRKQFGKPIAAFQAVQLHVVTAAQASVRLAMAAELAAKAVEAGDGRFEVAAAKVLAEAAVDEATRAAHQAHGAMGVTREYPLHHLSRRLWSWRHEYGRAATWRRHLGVDVAAAGADRLFATVTRAG
jgi:alkylation response protein AidB-like acyl-CoA dehydrogenase